MHQHCDLGYCCKEKQNYNMGRDGISLVQRVLVT